MIKSEKHNSRLNRLLKLIILISSYHHYTQAVLYSKAAGAENSIPEAESMSEFINSFFQQDSDPSDFIHKESDMVEKAFEHYDKLKEWYQLAQTTDYITPKQIRAFCNAVEYGNRVFSLKCSEFLYYPKYLNALLCYLTNACVWGNVRDSFIEYSVYTDEIRQVDSKLFRKSIIIIENLFLEISDKQKVREKKCETLKINVKKCEKNMRLIYSPLGF